MIAYIFQHVFAGLWGVVWHFGIAIGLVVLFAVGAYFALRVGATGLAKVCVACAIFCGALFGGEIIGVKMSAKRCLAQEKAVNTFVTKTVRSTTTKKSRRAADPWDRKDY